MTAEFFLSRWTCDRCGLVVVRDDHGFPKGWIFVKDYKTTHRCPDCQDDVPDSKKGYPRADAR